MTAETTLNTASEARICVIGESIIDIVRSGSSVVEHAGGSPLNVAVGLARLGMPVDAVTYLGEDAHGAWLRAHLDASGVQGVHSATGIARATSTAQVTLDAEGSASYVFDMHWQLPDSFVAPPATRLIHTGSIATVLEPGATQVDALIRAQADDVFVTYDPNLRPQIMGSVELARERVENFCSLAQVVKASAEDLAWAYASMTLVEAAQHLLSRGPTLVVVTDGGASTIAVSSAGAVEFAPPRVEVVDTIGAGDSFMAGLIAALVDQGVVDAFGDDRERALASIDVGGLLAFAARCAAITVTRAGAQPPWRYELH
ncbi:MAG: carbohydrate kinase [Microbacteriaceae bacterium]|nr:carbohydrate kinase [Microbacteriaceae bacterium]